MKIQTLTHLLLIIFVVFVSADYDVVHKIVEQEKLLSHKNLWDGFDPQSIPLVVFDGTNTYLVNHPNPPKDFMEHENETWMVYTGLYPAVRANTSIKLNDISIAVVMLRDLSMEKDYILKNAGLILHEKFHVYQAEKYPGWGTNEAVLFMYPYREEENILLRKMELYALVKAFKAKGKKESLDWLRQAIDLRSQRYESISPEFSNYERRVELVEGSATYIEHIATNNPLIQTDDVPSFEPTETRKRAYTTGYLLISLWHKYNPDGLKKLDCIEGSYPDQLISAFLKNHKSSNAIPESVKKEYTELTKNQIVKINTEIKSYLKSFEDPDEYKIIVDSSANPLFPKGFDPMNIISVDKKRIIHKRFLKLGNKNSNLEMLNTSGITTGTDKHPLYYGITKAEFNLGKKQPTFEQQNTNLKITTDSLKLELNNVDITQDGKTYIVKLK
ncbi:MAG: hypothetical protein JW737_05055 [Acidobacteria bacterium]|nr:hypothetical protein [Acidobacteriota bacterium]